MSNQHRKLLLYKTFLALIAMTFTPFANAKSDAELEAAAQEETE